MLLYRQSASGLEVLLVHPSGWYNKKAPWSIPKGLPEIGESLVQAALRELEEETGLAPSEAVVALDAVRYRSGKQVYGFCAPSPPNGTPRCASWEVDRAEFIPIEQARRLLHEAQRAFLDRLEERLGRTSGDATGRLPTG